MDKLIDAKQAALILSINEKTLANWRTLGKGPAFIRLGGGRGPVRYRESDLDAWTRDPPVSPPKPRDLVTPPLRAPRMPPVRRKRAPPPPSIEVAPAVSRAVSQALDEGLTSTPKILGRASQILGSPGPDLDALEAAAATVVTLEAGWHSDDVSFAVASAAMEDAPDLAEGAMAKLHALDAQGEARPPAKRKRRG